MADDEIQLDAKDLLDIFGADDDKPGEDLTKSIEDLFFSGDGEEGEGEKLSLEGVAEAPELPPPAEEPPLVEPDRKGMTEEQWRTSQEYADFKQQVIARHLKKKADEEAAKKAAEERAAEELRQHAAEDEAKRKQDLLEKYKAAKAATVASRVQAVLNEQEAAEKASHDSEKEKSDKFKNYLADLKGKMGKEGLPKLAMARPGAPLSSGSAAGLVLDVEKCKQLAAMFETTRSELLAQVAEKIGKKPANALMKKTLAKVAKAHLDIYGRAAVNPKNELREDGALDVEKLSRAFYAVPEAARVAKLQKALYELIEMRFIGVELGLGARTKGFVVSKALDGMEKNFKKNAYDAALVKWYQADVVPSTALSEGEEDSY